jgi:hypothetical protein
MAIAVFREAEGLVLVEYISGLQRFGILSRLALSAEKVLQWMPA